MSRWSLFLVTAAGALAATQEPPADIVQKFAAKEAEFAKARAEYTYRQTARIQELSENGAVGGRYEMVSDIVFPAGKRQEKVVNAPVSTLRNIVMTPEDEQDIRDVQPFVLTTAEIDQYWVRYIGTQKVDEISCYVFAVKPKKLEEGKRYFSGQIWVDDRDLQIVKTYGRGTGKLKRGSDQQFPKFETYRDQIDKKYWFPVYTRADDTLFFQNGPQRIRMIVQYKDYKRFASETTIKYGDVVDDKSQPKPETKK